MTNVKTMLADAITHGASDVHINVSMPPIMRINTQLVAMELPPVTEEEAKQMTPIQLFKNFVISRLNQDYLNEEVKQVKKELEKQKEVTRVDSSHK